VTLPIDRTATAQGMAPEQSPAIRSAEPLNGLRVLCIDNEPLILEGMKLLLDGWGCTVTTADSLATTCALTTRGDIRPDAIIADYHLDDGTGIEAIAEIRRQFGGAIPALLVTADRSPEVRAAAERDGVALQNKPVRPASMRAWLTQLSVAMKAAAE
jgi:CheY-like chemotaxis protein